MEGGSDNLVLVQKERQFSGYVKAYTLQVSENEETLTNSNGFTWKQAKTGESLKDRKLRTAHFHKWV